MKKLFVSLLAISVVCGGAVFAPQTAVAEPINYLYFDEIQELDTPPECFLTLEEEKVKNMTEFGYYRVSEEREDDKDVWYFSCDGETSGNPEIRFITDGTQTVNKPYDLSPVPVTSFSFSYRLYNNKESDVVDLENEHYIIQILTSQGTYPILEIDITKSSSYWETVTVDANTTIYRSAETYGDIDDTFCGFLFKMGSLDGELAITDITVNVDPAYVPPETSEETSSETESLESSETSETSETSSVQESANAPSSSTVSSEEAVEEKDGCSSLVLSTPIVGGTLLASALFIALKRKR